MDVTRPFLLHLLRLRFLLAAVNLFRHRLIGATTRRGLPGTSQGVPLHLVAVHINCRCIAN